MLLFSIANRNLTAFFLLAIEDCRCIISVDLAGLRAFRQDYPECRTLILYRGRQQLLIDEILAVPVERFLKGIIPNHPLPDRAWRD